LILFSGNQTSPDTFGGRKTVVDFLVAGSTFPTLILKSNMSKNDAAVNDTGAISEVMFPVNFPAMIFKSTEEDVFFYPHIGGIKKTYRGVSTLVNKNHLF
jgi:hypothetical protein